MAEPADTDIAIVMTLLVFLIDLIARMRARPAIADHLMNALRELESDPYGADPESHFTLENEQ